VLVLASRSRTVKRILPYKRVQAAWLGSEMVWVLAAEYVFAVGKTQELL